MRLAKTFEIHLVLIMPIEWLLQVCKNNGSLKITNHRRICFVRKWKHFKTNSTTEIRKPVKLFEFLAHSNRYRPIPLSLISLLLSRFT